jgi:murein DD-endopeptidase MepM/ murein hydrolase activator NlpD
MLMPGRRISTTHNPYVVSLLALALVLASCSRQPEHLVESPDRSNMVETRVPLPAMLPSPELAVVSERPEQPQSLPTAYFTLTPSPASIRTQKAPALTPNHLISEVCSPLRDHQFVDFLEIVTFPYDPPPPGKDGGHHGVDFAYYRWRDRVTILGTAIESALAGKVAGVVDNRPPYGNMIIIETPHNSLPDELVELLDISRQESAYLLYAHMGSPPLLTLGTQVKCGQELGEVGSTPPEWSSAPHLHLEVRVGKSGAVFNGMAFYTTTASHIESENYQTWRMSGYFRLVDPMDLIEYGIAHAGH